MPFDETTPPHREQQDERIDTGATTSDLGESTVEGSTHIPVEGVGETTELSSGTKSADPRENKPLAEEMFSAEYPVRKIMENIKASEQFPDKEHVLAELEEKADFLADQARENYLELKLHEAREQATQRREFRRAIEYIAGNIVGSSERDGWEDGQAFEIAHYGHDFFGRSEINRFGKDLGDRRIIYLAQEQYGQFRDAVYAMLGAQAPPLEQLRFSAQTRRDAEGSWQSFEASAETPTNVPGVALVEVHYSGGKTGIGEQRAALTDYTEFAIRKTDSGSSEQSEQAA